MAETSEWDAALSMHVQGLSISPQKDLGLAELARRKFEFAEHEMFGMMVALTEFDPKHPVEGADREGRCTHSVREGRCTHSVPLLSCSISVR